jgi:hypothetical protein
MQRRNSSRSLSLMSSTIFFRRQRLLARFRHLANSTEPKLRCLAHLDKRETSWLCVGHLTRLCRSTGQCITLLQVIQSLECSKLHLPLTTFTSPTLSHPLQKTRSSISLTEHLNYNTWNLSLERGS